MSMFNDYKEKHAPLPTLDSARTNDADAEKGN